MSSCDLLSKWLNPQFLRTLLLDPDKNKSTCIQIARFVAAYYLDYLLFLPTEEGLLPSLYLWGNFQKEDLKPTDTLLDRTKVSSMLPVEYSPALPALLMVKCDSLIEAISYVDHFDDRRTSLVLRLLADSLHNKDLTIDFIKTMIVENLPLQIAESLKSPSPKFAQNFTESILQLDVAMQDDLIQFMEQHLIATAEFVFSELPLESEEVLPNPIYEAPGDVADSEEGRAFMEIFGYVQILLESFARSNRIVDQLNFTVKLISNDSTTSLRVSSNYTLHRVLLLMLRITYRHLFSVALRENHENLGKIAERYKELLKEDDQEHILLRDWYSSAEEDDMERIQNFIDWIQNNYQQNSSLPPLTSTTRELWLRRIVLNSTTNHRDVRQERTMDWFRSVCHPKHRVCDVTMSQMLFINTQWTSPGFTFIQPGCLALRLSIHPHDLCLGTTTTGVNLSASARDILYRNPEEVIKDKQPIFTPRLASPDLITKYAEKHDKLARQMAETTRNFTPIEEQLRAFSRQQDELQMELKRESEFLRRAGHYHYPDNNDDSGFGDGGLLRGIAEERNRADAASKNSMDEALAKQLNLLNAKLDEVVKGLADRQQKSMYIREEDEQSELSEIPLEYDDAPVGGQVPVIEKLDFGMLSSRTPAPIGDLSFKEEKEFHQSSEGSITPKAISSSDHLSTAKSFSNPLFTEKHPKIPMEWMKLLPLEAGSARHNLLTFDRKLSEILTTPRQDDYLFRREIVSERGIGTQTSYRKNSVRSGETQTNDDVANVTRKVVDMKSVKRLSVDDMKMVMDRVAKF
ncbi:Protein CBG21542 [Caenorhabditis briggsae]|uniref:Uncharacterized protein n=2 Tax=Caenorhabditis briggsae TaxID=6238 RepID=A0AAE9ELP3_CAEBR|nr:Protein CBG21542 [Caenorhabditis briggsae]ULT93422.1 hypothetical protein L3Y34_003127 [Caenorhabditis briggsae]UMM26681.1 hypothetical protein L5515_010281 [Caenorhabditis briggsae]CAP38309.2 Protein CBG21542 [Caenorhabditis briggsae]